MRVKPLSRLEMKILIYNKVKRGMSYDDAKKELQEEIISMRENSKQLEKQISLPNTISDKFKEEFNKLQ